MRPSLWIPSMAGSASRKRRQRLMALLTSSPLFDEDWYVRTYPDVAKAGIDPGWHYIEFGWREGRDPGPLFSTNSYLKSNPDVARSGANPLLHFIEFGYSEGRGTSKHRAITLSAQSPGEPFGPAAPCYSSALTEDAPVRWRRSSRFDLTANSVHTRDGLFVGCVSQEKIRDILDAAFARLRELSGYGGHVSPSASPEPAPNAAALLDSWYLNRGSLRTRWECERPIVVRAYQHDPDCAGELRLVAEGISRTHVDFVDVSLCNPYFPVLFVLSDPQGTVRGSQFLAFPSLCRGGIHYSELLALSRNGEAIVQSPDFVGRGQDLADRLLALLHGDGNPLVRALSIDLSGANGSHPLFQPDFRAWLARVARIGIRTAERSELDPGAAFLASTVQLEVPDTRTASRGILVLSGDMVPTISILASMQGPERDGLVETTLSLLVPGSEPSQPATLFELPPISGGKLLSARPDYAPTWPRLIGPAESGPSDQVTPASIRVPSGREYADAEILVPISGRLPDIGSQPITWLIWADGWRKETLVQALEALSLQTGMQQYSIAFIGDAERAVLAVANQLFEHRVCTYPYLESAAPAIETNLVAYLGTGVILHDERCSQLIAAMLRDPAVATASCVLVRSELRGRHWFAGIVDAGYSAPSRHRGGAIAPEDAQRIWRSSYPVVSPVRHFWVARTRSLAKWTRDGGDLINERLHVCTSIVTATHECGSPEEPSFVPPSASALNSLRVEPLFG